MLSFFWRKEQKLPNEKSRVLRTWLDKISTRIREKYKLRNGGHPMFRLKCCTSKDEDEEIEFKIMKVLKY